MKTEDLFGKALNYKDETETKDYLWILHLCCEDAGIKLEILPDTHNGQMILTVGGEEYGIVSSFTRGDLTKSDIVNVISSALTLLKCPQNNRE